MRCLLPLLALMAPLTAISAQEPAAEVSPVVEESPYFAPDWIPGTTELYYGPSFLDRSLVPVDLHSPVDLGLVDVQSRVMPRGGAEHVGALFFAIEEEAQAGFPMQTLPSPGCDG